MPIILMPGKWKVEEQKFKVIFRYIASSGPAWDTLDSILENKINSRNTMGLPYPSLKMSRTDYRTQLHHYVFHQYIVLYYLF